MGIGNDKGQCLYTITFFFGIIRRTNGLTYQFYIQRVHVQALKINIFNNLYGGKALPGPAYM